MRIGCPGDPTAVRSATKKKWALSSRAGSNSRSLWRGRAPSHHAVRAINQLDREVPAEHEVHLILDNYATHKTPKIHR
jgi:hypothetical protein